jgi:hypothetical protein
MYWCLQTNLRKLKPSNLLTSSANPLCPTPGAQFVHAAERPASHVGETNNRRRGRDARRRAAPGPVPLIAGDRRRLPGRASERHQQRRHGRRGAAGAEEGQAVLAARAAPPVRRRAPAARRRAR